MLENFLNALRVIFVLSRGVRDELFICLNGLGSMPRAVQRKAEVVIGRKKGRFKRKRSLEWNNRFFKLFPVQQRKAKIGVSSSEIRIKFESDLEFAGGPVEIAVVENSQAEVVMSFRCVRHELYKFLKRRDSFRELSRCKMFIAFSKKIRCLFLFVLLLPLIHIEKLLVFLLFMLLRITPLQAARKALQLKKTVRKDGGFRRQLEFAPVEFSLRRDKVIVVFALHSCGAQKLRQH